MENPQKEELSNTPSEPTKDLPVRRARQRKWAPKVRTGCTTCRKRRIKCDESKPTCKNCLSRGFPCVAYGGIGYTALPRAGRRTSQLNYQPVYFLAPSGIDPTPQERQMFDMLCTRVTEVAGGYDVPFWAVDVLQAATQAHPAIWHASLALSALHHRMKILHRREHGSFAQNYYIAGIKQYNASIGYLMTLMQKQNLTYVEKQAVVLTSLMQYALCCVQRSLKSAKIHAVKALKLFYEWRLWEVPSDYRGILSPMGLSRQVASCYDDMESVIEGIVPPDLPRHIIGDTLSSTRPFNSPEDALFAYLAIRLGAFDGDVNDAESQGRHPLFTKQLRRTQAKVLWRERFRDLQRSNLPQQQDSNVMNYLKLNSEWDILHKEWIDPKCPQNRQKLIPKVLRVLDKAEDELRRQCSKSLQSCGTTPDTGSNYIPTSLLEPSFSFSVGPLNVIQRIGNLTYCLPFRQKAIQILRKYPFTEGLWSNRVAYKRLEVWNLFRSKAGFDDTNSKCGCDPVTVKPCDPHRAASHVVDLETEGFVTITYWNLDELRQGLPGVSGTFPA